MNSSAFGDSMAPPEVVRCRKGRELDLSACGSGDDTVRRFEEFICDEKRGRYLTLC